MSSAFRDLPSMTKLLAAPLLIEARVRHSQAAITAAARTVLEQSRRKLIAGEQPALTLDTLAEEVVSTLELQLASVLRPVINATGIVLHTNLGRSVLHESAACAALDAAREYVNLEIDLESGKRTSRSDVCRDGLRSLTGAENGLVVNNCAAATVLALRAVAASREVIISRGQLVEIGGSFRIPEVMAASGAILREVGTTNITRLSDYEQAIGPSTAVLMRVHASNYRVRGYTKSVELQQLIELGRKHNLIVIDDVGSGQAVDLAPFGLPGEPLVSASIAAGADLVLFSGDKLLGGPQCGILVGTAALVHQLERDPLMRAFRPDKLTLAALDATLRLYRDPARAISEIPTLRMLTTPLTSLRARCESLAEKLRAIRTISIEIRDDSAYVGGGSLPDVSLPTVVLAISSPQLSESELARRLRTGLPSVLGRVQDGRVFLDLRCVFENQLDDLLNAIQSAAG